MLRNDSSFRVTRESFTLHNKDVWVNGSGHFSDILFRDFRMDRQCSNNSF